MTCAFLFSVIVLANTNGYGESVFKFVNRTWKQDSAKNIVVEHGSSLNDRAPVWILGDHNGLGNRVWQLLTVVAYVMRTKEQVQVYWHGGGRLAKNVTVQRQYPLLLDAQGVDIITTRPTSPRFGKRIPNAQDLTLDETLTAGRAIRPKFRIIWSHAPHVGVHIRATDMLRYDLPLGHAERWTLGQVRQLMARACKYIRSLDTPTVRVFVASDTAQLKEEFEKSCSTLTFVQPVRTKPRGVPSSYVDFFALASCLQIVPVSKVSTFSFMAAAVGNSLLVSMYNQHIHNFRVRHLIGDSSPLPSPDGNDTAQFNQRWGQMR